MITLLQTRRPSKNGPVAQWIRHLTTDQGIPGSSPGGVAQLFFTSFATFKIYSIAH